MNNCINSKNKLLTYSTILFVLFYPTIISGPLLDRIDIHIEVPAVKYKDLSDENKGHLYTKGFFRYSMHINYFGDLLWVTGYAFVTHNWYAVIIPVFIFCFFAFYNIPKLDEYLHSKYGEEFSAYEKRTKKFIPYIY